jgi:hypothetical protein
MISVFVLIFAFVVSAFMKEIPLRKAHYTTEALPADEGAQAYDAEPSTPGAKPALKPVAGGSNGHQEH